MGQGVKVAVASGNTVTVCVWIRKSASGYTSGVNYVGDEPRLIVRANPALGSHFFSDTVLATSTLSTNYGTWGGNGVGSPLCGTTSATAADGEAEFIVDCDMTAAAYTTYAGSGPGWINVADWSTSTGVNPAGSQQFWFNGVPFDTSTPASSTGILGGGF